MKLFINHRYWVSYMTNENVEMVYEQGVSYMGQGEKNKALEFFDKALKLDNYYLPAWNDKGVILLENKDFHGALDCFERVILLNPADPLSYYNKGYVQLLLEDYKGSIETFEGFLNIYTKKNDFQRYAFLLKAKANHALNENEEALRLLEIAVKKDRSFKEARDLYITILREQKSKND